MSSFVELNSVQYFLIILNKIIFNIYCLNFFLLMTIHDCIKVILVLKIINIPY